jgi:excisionase family DNA binding protein
MVPVDDHDMAQWHTYDEAAEILGVSTRTVMRHVADRKIESVRVGGRVFITHRALLEYVNAGVSRPDPPPGRAPRGRGMT